MVPHQAEPGLRMIELLKRCQGWVKSTPLVIRVAAGTGIDRADLTVYSLPVLDLLIDLVMAFQAFRRQAGSQGIVAFSALFLKISM